MRIKPAIGSVVGPATANQWGQVLLTPGAYGLIEVFSDIGLARQHGVEILTKLTQGLATEPKSLKAVAAIAESISKSDLKTVLLLVPVGQVVYLALRGHGAVYLKRGEKIAALMKEAGDISGEVRRGDTLLLASDGFIQALSEAELTQTFDHLNAVEASEKLTLLLHEKANGFGSAALLFQVTDLVPAEAEETDRVNIIAQPRPMERKIWRPRRPDLASVKRFFRRRSFPRLSTLRHKLRQGLRSRNKLQVIVALCFLFLFVVSVVLGIRRQAMQKQSYTFIKAVNEAQHAFEEGVALLPLSPVKSRERLAQAKNLLEPLTKTVSPRSKEGRELFSFYQKVVDNLANAMQIIKGEPQLFFDTSLLKKDSVASAFYLDNDSLGIIDTPGRTVATLALSTKRGQIVAGGEAYQGATLISVDGDTLYTLVPEGIYAAKVGDKQKANLVMVIKKDNQWGTVAALVVYGGNLYLLDSSKSRIWKYTATENGFSAIREYLNPDTLPDLGRATGMAIDGSVWVGTGSGKIWRFTQGKENTFIPQGVEPSFGDNLVIYTSDAVKNLYVLDGQEKRVVVLDKDGIYLAQYVWEGNFQPGQLAVSETQKKILLLTEGKIYALELK